MNKFESQLTLYRLFYKNDTVYFKNKSLLDNYMKDNNISLAYITKIEYMGNILNSIDVIRQTYEDNSYRYISVANEEGYMLYNHNLSIKEGQPVWTYIPGSLRDMYDAFKANGIKLEDDTYQRIDDSYRIRYQKYLKKQSM